MDGRRSPQPVLGVLPMKKILFAVVFAIVFVVIVGSFGVFKAVLGYRIWTLGILTFCLSFAAWIGVGRLAVDLAGYVRVRYGRPMINGLTEKGWGALLGLSLICSLVFPLVVGSRLHFPLLGPEPIRREELEDLGWKSPVPQRTKYYLCQNGDKVPEFVKRCPDGSIPDPLRMDKQEFCERIEAGENLTRLKRDNGSTFITRADCSDNLFWEGAPSAFADKEVHP